MTTEATIRRRALRLKNRMRFSQSDFAREARINRSVLNMFLQGHVSLRPDQLAAVDKAIAVVVHKRLETLRELLPTNEG